MTFGYSADPAGHSQSPAEDAGDAAPPQSTFLKVLVAGLSCSHTSPYSFVLCTAEVLILSGRKKIAASSCFSFGMCFRICNVCLEGMQDDNEAESWFCFVEGALCH